MTKTVLRKGMICDGLSGSGLINSVNSIRPLERQAFTHAQALNPGETFIGRAIVSMAAIGENIKAKNFITLLKGLTPQQLA